MDGERKNVQAPESLGHFVDTLGDGGLNLLPAALVVYSAQGLRPAVRILREEDVGIPRSGGFEEVGQEGGSQVRHVAGHH
jgi:hypothetical protein